MKNKGLNIMIAILVICVLGLSGYILYDKILDTDKLDVENKNNEIIETQQEFINAISKTEKELESKSEYIINYKDFSFTASKNEYNNIGNIIIKYKDKQINKDLSKQGEYGLKTLNTYYFDEEKGLFILTLETTPVASSPNSYIIAFDSKGNIHLDESVGYEIYADENRKTLFYRYNLGGGIDCYGRDVSLEENYIIESVIISWYTHNELTELTKVEKTYKDLPKCE